MSDSYNHNMPLPATRQNIILKKGAATGFFISLIILYPGFVSWDSIEQLVQARDNFILDWHPPIMAYIWSWLDKIISGPFGMLVLTMFLTWTGIYLIFSNLFFRNKNHAIILVALMWITIFFPPIFGIMGFIVKDFQMAGWLLTALGLTCKFVKETDAKPLLLDIQEGRYILMLLGILICSVLGVAYRYNAFAAVFPFFWFLMYEIYFSKKNRLIRLGLSSLLAVIPWLASISFAFILNSVLTDQHLPVSMSLTLFDISGIAIRDESFFNKAETKQALEPMLAKSGYYLEKIRAAYDPEEWGHLSVEHGGVFEMGNLSSEQQKRVNDIWLTGVTLYPKAYLQHRLSVFEKQLVSSRGVWFFVPISISRYGDEKTSADKIQHYYKLSALQETVKYIHSIIATETWLFKPLIYLCLIFFMMIVAYVRLRSSNYSLIFFLCISAIFYETSLFFFAPAVDYRYSHWMILATCLAFILIIADGIVNRRHQIN